MLGRKADLKVGGDFQTAPADKYTVQINDVNFKIGFNSFKGVEEEKLQFNYVILDDKPMVDSEGNQRSTRGITFTDRVSQSLNERATLRKLAKAVLGRDLTKEELDPKSPRFFNPEDLVGKQVGVMLTEDPNKDGTAMFNNVASYVTAIAKLPELPKTQSGQTVVETETKAVNQVIVDTPNLAPELDNFLGGLEKDAEEDDDSQESEAEESEEEELSLEELEAQLKIARAKAKQAKAKK